MSSVTGIRHAGITVRNLEEALKFYRDALGLEVTSQGQSEEPYLSKVTGMPVTSVKTAHLAIPGTAVDIELLEWGGIERHPASCRPCDWGSGHVCLCVEDIDSLLAALVSAGYPARVERPHAFTAGHNAGAKAVYATDPDGYTVELFEPRAL
jgi:catechol 2,3-dioxygenase-like lactoylglutathione lyase family enzyme